MWTRDVLNLGASPARLVAAVRARFEAAGGRVLERTALQGLRVHPDGVRLQLGGGGGGTGGSNGAASQQRQQEEGSLTARLVLDCMGHASPVVQQVRWGRKPDGVCLVVGACCRGFDPDTNTTGDVILTNCHSQPAASSSSSGSNGSSSNGNGSSSSNGRNGSSSSEGVFNTQVRALGSVVLATADGGSLTACRVLAFVAPICVCLYYAMSFVHSLPGLLLVACCSSSGRPSLLAPAPRTAPHTSSPTWMPRQAWGRPGEARAERMPPPSCLPRT